MTNDNAVFDSRLPKLIFELSSLLLNNIAIEAAMLTCLPQAGDQRSSSSHSIYCPESVTDISRHFRIAGLLEWELNGGLARLMREWSCSAEKCIVDGRKIPLVVDWDPAKRCLALVKTFWECIYINTGASVKYEAMVKFAIKYFFHSLMGNMEKYYKYHSLSLFSKLMDQEYPRPIPLTEGEEPGFLVGGWLERHFLTLYKRLQKSKTLENVLLGGVKPLPMKEITLLTSIIAVKRGCLALDSENQDQFVIKHKLNMVGGAYYAAAEPLRNGELDSELFDVGVTLSELTNMVYPNHFESTIPYWRVPSIRSTFENNRMKGGTHAAFGIESKTDSTMEQYYVGTIGEDPLNQEPLYSWGFNIVDIKQKCLDALHQVEYCHAKIHLVNEPFKVRTITAGSALIYHLGRLIQSPLHKFLRVRPEFQLIGTGLSESLIGDYYKGSLVHDNLTFDDLYERGFFTTFTFIVAGDFSEATDAMHPKLPKIFIETMFLSGKIDVVWRRVLELTLGPHILHYSDEQIKQLWGQLMGSPDSFIVLNLVNAAILWASVNEYYGGFRSWDWIVKVWRPLFNGDDVTFLSNPVHMKIWTRMATSAGMNPSPGKNFTLVEMIQINSHNFYVNYSQPSWADEGARTILSVEEIFILNSGLLHCQAKVISDTRREKSAYRSDLLQPITDQYQELIHGCPDDVKGRLLPVFRQYIEPKLVDNPRSWWLPSSLGGLGLPFQDPRLVRQGFLITRSQGVYAKKLMLNCTLDPIKDLIEKAPYLVASAHYLDNLLTKLNVKKVPGTFVRSVLTDVPDNPNKGIIRTYPAPSLAHCFLGGQMERAAYNPNRDKWAFLHAAGRLLKKGKPSLTNRDCRNLLDGVYKYIPGGLDKSLSVSRVNAPGDFGKVLQEVSFS